jgi:predicted nuclease of predicted toxin-antitoxin system
MKFLVDNQLPGALTRFFNELGFDAEHVPEVGLDESRDSEIAAYATNHKLIIVTKDEDFSVLSALGRFKAPVIWVRLGNCRTLALKKAFSSWLLLR